MSPDYFAAVAGSPERSDEYPAVAHFRDDLRAIRCRDDLQFILQRRRQSGRWHDLGYFRDWSALIERAALAREGAS